MFGYFNPRNSRSFRNIRKKYKSFYCSTCKALQYNYGHLSTTLLSYDIALFSMFLNLDTSYTKVNRLSFPFHCGSFKNVFNNKSWKVIAALNLLTFAEKLNDDIYDDNSGIAKIALKLYKIPIKRAKEDFPAMAKEIKEGYLRIIIKENQNAEPITIARDFSKMMWSAISNYLDVSEQQRKFLFAMSSWIYIIDALDDYDSDARKKVFNPFVNKNLRFKHYLESHRQSISKIFEDIFVDCLTYNDDNFDYPSAEILVNSFIPDVTKKILDGASLKAVQIRTTFLECGRWLPWMEE